MSFLGMKIIKGIFFISQLVTKEEDAANLVLPLLEGLKHQCQHGIGSAMVLSQGLH